MEIALPVWDLTTLLRVCALLALPFGAALVALAAGLQRQRTALLNWAAFDLLLFIGLWLATLRGELADLYSYTLADTCLIVAFILWRRGNRLYFGRDANSRYALLAAALFAVALHLSGFPAQNLKLGGVLIYSMLAWTALRGSLELARSLDNGFHWVPRFLAVVPTAAFGVFSLVKLLLIATVPHETPISALVLLQQPRELNIAYVLMGFFGILGVNIAFAFLLVMRLYGDADRFRYLAQHDTLTNLYNRRGLAENLEREIARHSRSGAPFSLLMLDVDHFKQFNDTYGHACGDEVLRWLAGVLGHTARREDLVARIGGEEFCVLLPDAEEVEALHVAERIRLAVATEPTPRREQRITVSIGVATHAHNEEQPAALMERADGALYRAKSAGRNRVELATG